MADAAPAKAKATVPVLVPAAIANAVGAAAAAASVEEDPYSVDTEPDVDDLYDADGLITCPLCGNRWDGSAQCFPCVLFDRPGFDSVDKEEEEEEGETAPHAHHAHASPRLL